MPRNETEAAVTVTEVAPLIVPLVARTVSLPIPELGAVYAPLVLMVPPAPPESTDQVNAGGLASAWPNWSVAVAVNNCVALSTSDKLAGSTAIAVSVCATVTVTLLVAVSPPGSAIVTRKV